MRIRLTVQWIPLTPDTLFAITIGGVELLSILQTPDGLKGLICTKSEVYRR